MDEIKESAALLLDKRRAMVMEQAASAMHIPEDRYYEYLARAIRESDEANAWRPIETAPRDGTVIICALPGKRPFTAHFAQIADDFGNKDCWVARENSCHSVFEYEVVPPTGLLWQPLQEPPK